MTSMSLTLAGTGLGKTDMAGWIMSLETVMSAVGAICYGAFLKGRLGGFDLPIAIALETIGFAVMCNMVTVPGFVIGTVLYGFAFGVFNPAAGQGPSSRRGDAGPVHTGRRPEPVPVLLGTGPCLPGSHPGRGRRCRRSFGEPCQLERLVAFGHCVLRHRAGVHPCCQGEAS